jgi:hypothetical protein
MRPHPRRTITDPYRPEAWGTSDRSGFINNHKNLVFQHEWQGQDLVNLRVLVNPDEYDTPNRQLGTLVLPPDPLPTMNARPEQYPVEEVPVSTRACIVNGVTTGIRVVPQGRLQAFPVERIISCQGLLSP